MDTNQTNDWRFHRRVYKGNPRPEIQFSGEWANDGCPKLVSSDISLIFPEWKQAEENVIFVAPHDDDAFLGAGLLLEAVLRSQGNVYILIVTDGQNGYFKEEEKDTIEDTRRIATVAAAEVYGLKEQNIVWLHYTDGNLMQECTTTIPQENHVETSGLIKQITSVFREYKATRVVMPHADDDHLDHRIVNLAAKTSICHANGAIWQHLGSSANIRTVLEYAVYREFAKIPDLLVEAPQSAFDKKLAALAEYEKCQPQISGMVEEVRQNGPLEAFCTLKSASYSARSMKQLYF